MNSASFNVEIKIGDKSPEVLAALENAALRWLEASGMTVETAAKDNLTRNGSVDTGDLRDSVTHLVASDEKAVYVGVPQGPESYGIYVECGTGIYYPGGRQTPWVYQDRYGNWHLTHGQRAKPFLKPAVTDNIERIKSMLKDSLENA